MTTETKTRAAADGRVSPPKPGLYPSVPFETYCRWDALNHSTLKHMARSPKHFKHARDTPDPSETDSKRFGTGAHALLLEPARFATDVVPAPINEKTGAPYGSGTKAWAEYAARYPGKIVLTGDEIDAMRALSAAVFEDEDAAALLRIDGGMSEVCMVWDCPVTGLRCKGRVDRWIPRPEKMVLRVDVKTTRSAEWGAFGRSMVEYGYHTQEAFYARGAAALGYRSRGYIIAVESEAPHGINVAPIDVETMTQADSIVGEWLARVKKCTSENAWPGYHRPCAEFMAPEYWFRQFGNGID